jgi:hypothetical protein
VSRRFAAGDRIDFVLDALPTTARLYSPMSLQAILLVLASVCQWLGAGAPVGQGNPGMGAPLPASWEAVRPATLAGQSSDWRPDPQPAGVSAPGFGSADNRPLSSISLHVAASGRAGLLLWGRLLLDGG